MTRNKKTAKGQKGANAQAQSATQLKDGPRNAARTLKKTRRVRAAPPPVVPPVVLHKNTVPTRFFGRADPRLVAKEPVAASKHETYYEIVENTDKKKKLEYSITRDPIAPPGYTFVPLGNPELTKACKELSRNTDCMIFVVSVTGETTTDILSDHIHRVGYHFRSKIVDEASANIPLHSIRRGGVNIIQTYYSKRPPGEISDPLPATQAEINAQADAVIRDLFPRIPNTDRQEIIDHAFQLGKMFMRKPVVGIQAEVPLYRRVQLAVLAHIRHTHTRYDKLLRETDWATARASIETACLETLVKWRGDEETGRDQMDEILREIVVLSDSEDSDFEETGDDEDADMEEGELSEETSDPDIEMVQVQAPSVPLNKDPITGEPSQRQIISLLSPPQARMTGRVPNKDIPHRQDPRTDEASRRDRQAQRNERKGFKRYQAWNEVISRHQHEPGPFASSRPHDTLGNGRVGKQGLNGHNFSGFTPGNPQRHEVDQVSRFQTTPHKAMETVDLTESPYGKQVVSRPPVEDPSHFQSRDQRDIRYERREFSGQRSPLVRDGTSSSLQQTTAKSNLQDYLLPSIEHAPDRALEDRSQLPVLTRPSDVSKRHTLEASSRGLLLMSDGTYRDAQGVVRTQDGRRVIFIDENNREVTRHVDSSRRLEINIGEASLPGPLTLGGASSTRYHHESVAVDSHSSHSYFSTARNPGQANIDHDSRRPVLLEGRGGPREVSDTRYHSSLNTQPELRPGERSGSHAFYMSSQQSIMSKEQEVVGQRFRDVPETHVRAPAESSRFVHPASFSAFSDQNHGVARAEPISHSSSQRRERVVYNLDDDDEPIWVSENMGGAVRYFQDPSSASRTSHSQTVHHRPMVSAVQYGSSSRRPEVEYVDSDRSARDNKYQHRYAVQGFANRHDVAPMNHIGYERLPPADPTNGRAPLPRRDIASHDYIY